MSIRHRLLYEINTAHWLDAWSTKLGKTITLDQVPTSAWDTIAEQGADAVWLMGVWKRSPAAAQVVREHPSFASDRAFFPDLKPSDIAGSAFAVADWSVEPAFGGETALRRVREELKKRGLALYLDWVPNHVAPDHAWATQHPEWCIRGNDEDLARDPVSFIRIGKAVLARGRDPFFPA
ncbi:MAG TPA: alpha-amylase family glycosyl hydrolase [Planctomycetota bacterium]|nr:alpha-amylase family glycosyl hydrolase [Planctomycetota bacterium]